MRTHSFSFVYSFCWRANTLLLNYAVTPRSLIKHCTVSVCLSKSLMLSIYWKLRSHRNSRFIVEIVPVVGNRNKYFFLIYPCIHLSRAFCVLKIKVQWKYSSWQVVKWFMISVDSQMESLCITVSGVDWLLKMLLRLWHARQTVCMTSVIFELTSRCNYFCLASELLDDLTTVDVVSSTSTETDAL